MCSAHRHIMLSIYAKGLKVLSVVQEIQVWTRNRVRIFLPLNCELDLELPVCTSADYAKHIHVPSHLKIYPVIQEIQSGQESFTINCDIDPTLVKRALCLSSHYAKHLCQVN